MRSIGILIAIVGAIYVLIAFNMDVSISTPSTYVPGVGNVGGGDVANLDLMERRQNHLIVACFVTLIGSLMAIFGKNYQGKVGFESIGSEGNTRADAVFQGERNLKSDPYRLWLSDYYGITRNELFDRFVLADQTFDSLDDALAEPDRQESAKILAASEHAEQLRLEAEELDAKRIEEVRIAEAEWEEFRPKLYVGLSLMAMVLTGLYFLVRETPEERNARLAAEEAAASAAFEDASQAIGIKFPDDVKVIEKDDSGNSTWCNPEFMMNPTAMGSGNIVEYRFRTAIDATSLKKRFMDVYGEGEPDLPLLEDDNSDWRWSKGERKILLRHLDYEGGDEKIVCVASPEIEPTSKSP
ncbi:hypothetical protein LY632_07135 [Erythrobacter sp. SDW2]|uniref:hypothetical protein n=1 Tax=Erythrobacter sp. SDW2 TaxID=2907154 RepID=UPI001F3A8CFC|nr:hypothetical protein [Erythrobacter sp. SDW2]UIP08160.1 hypothetical protein LY632_07135 [Erythrobacter sp. SDW2]